MKSKTNGTPKLPDLGPTAIDIFGGCGGTITGFKMAGFRPITMIEINPLSAKVAKMNHPKTKVIVTDVRNVNPDQIRPIDGKIDVITASPPCQGFSTMTTKRKNKTTDPRNNLIIEILKFATALNPRTILIENVPAFLKTSEFSITKKSLTNLGYQVDTKILNAADFGIPQRRKRTIALFAKDFQPQLPTRGSTSPQTVRNAIGNLSVSDQQEWLHNRPRKTSALVRERIAAVPHDGGTRADLPKHLQLRCHANVRGFNDTYGRMWWNKPAPTLTRYFDSPGCGRFIHPDQDRAITPYEGLILQGFPKTYQFDKSLSPGNITSMIGEAFPPQWVMRLAKYIQTMLQIIVKEEN